MKISTIIYVKNDEKSEKKKKYINNKIWQDMIRNHKEIWKKYDKKEKQKKVEIRRKKLNNKMW